MITNFEEQTKDLTEIELKYAKQFIKGFQNKIGKENAITSNEIKKKYKEIGVLLDGPRIRKIINFIRCRGLVPGLIATSNGYYVSKDKKEVEKYIKSLDERIKSIEMVKRKTQKYFNSLT